MAATTLYKRHMPAGLRIASILEAIRPERPFDFFWEGGEGALGVAGGGGGREGDGGKILFKKIRTLFFPQK